MGILLAVGFVAVPAQKAAAADATTIYIDLASSTAEILKKNSTVSGSTPPDSRSYIQGRVLLLDANGKLATTFGGAAIADATLELQSVNAGSDFEYSTNSATETLSFTKAASEKVSINLDGAYQEFAVRYDDGSKPLIDFTGAETLRFTLKKGTSTLTQDASITIKAPEANCYVVRTGSISTLPAVLETIPGQKNNDSAVVQAGSDVKVHVFAAYTPDEGTTYYFTDNVPENGKMVLVQGVVPGSSTTTDNAATIIYSPPNGGIIGQDTVTIAQSMVTLTNGYASASVTVSNLKIPEVIKLLGKSESAGDMAPYLNGSDSYKIYWVPFALGTRAIGDRLNDVDSSEYLQIAATNNIGHESTAPSDYDTSVHKPGTCKKIHIVGLPVNTVTSMGVFGYTGILKPGYYTFSGFDSPSALDAYFLLNATKKDWKTKPSAFKVAGNGASDSYVIGAIVGQDEYGNPAPFGTSTATFALKKTGGAVFAPRSTTFTDWVDTVDLTAGTIKAKKAAQAFLPFAMTATFSSSAISGTAVSDLYIDATASSGFTAKTVEDIDSASEGVSFYMQDYIASITNTSYTPAIAGADVTIKAEGRGSNAEKAFDLKGVVRKKAGYTQLQLGKKKSTSAQTEYALANKSGNLAEGDIAIFTKSSTTQPVFIGYTGQTNGTLVVSCVTATLDMEAADPGKIDLKSISNFVGYSTVAVDDEEDHDTLELNNTYQIVDGYGNTYTSIEKAKVSPFVYTVDASGNPTTTLFPGAKADTSYSSPHNTNTVEVSFDLSKITADNSKAAVVLKSDSGAVASQPTILDLKSLTSLKAKSYYVPVEGISNHPYIFYFADQNGNMIKPVTVTTDNGNHGDGQKVDVDIEADDNGTTTASAKETLSTKKEYLIKTARLNTGKKSMSVDFESDFGDATLVINPSAADLEKPVILTTLTAIDCGFEITITDNKEVDAAATVVTVKNAGGEDITSTLTKTVASDSGTSAVIRLKGTPVGSYSVDVTAKDKAGNTQTASGLLVTVTTANECSVTPECLDVEPAFVKYGDPATVVTITGKNTNFGAGTTVDFSCAAVTEGAVTVNSSTELTVSITVPATGTDQDCDITVTTGSETITCAGKFQVLAEAPVVCVDNDHDTYGENCPAGDDCNDNDPAVNPGAEEICGDGIDNNCDGNIDEGCAPTCSISVSGNLRAGFILPRIFVITVTGTGTGFSTSSEVTFSDTTNIRKLAQIPSGNSIRVIGIVRPKAKGTTVTVSVAGCGSKDVVVQ